MPKLVKARVVEHAEEDATIRQLARSRMAPKVVVQRARMIVGSWEGQRTTEIAAELGCHPQTVRESLHRFNELGMDGLRDRQRSGRQRRISEAERSIVIALVGKSPPGRLIRATDGELRAEDEETQAHWTLDALTEQAQQQGIAIKRSQVRRILLAEGVRWRSVRSWAISSDPEFEKKRTDVIELYTQPPPDSIVICVDELGPVTPRTFPPAPAWSPDSHRIKAPLEYSRGTDKAWVYGALTPKDGHEITMSARSRNSDHYCQFLLQLEQAHPIGNLFIITDNLSSHTSLKTRTWLADHPRIQQVFIPKRAAWLNLQEGWWRLLRREAFAGQTFADYYEIARATAVATHQLNQRAQPWVWGRPQKPPRHKRRLFVYRI